MTEDDDLDGDGPRGTVSGGGDPAEDTSSGDGTGADTASGDVSASSTAPEDIVCEDAPVDDVVVYAGSNGQYYSDWQVGRRLASDEWRLCVRDRELDRRLVGTTGGELLMLERTSIDALPVWAEVRSIGSAVHIVDTRRALPSGSHTSSQ